MNQSTKPLIVGGGPTGTGAALFLARAGIATCVIDAAPAPTTLSKALAVNPRTLEILEPTGITQKMLAIGQPIRGGIIRQGRKVVAHLLFEQLHHKYPFMLALSQATTERLLREAFEAAGGRIERGITLSDCRNDGDGVAVDLTNVATGETESVHSPWMLAADGAHSAARRALGVGFPGSTFASPWYLADVPLETTLESDSAHIIFLDAGFLFMLRVIGDDTALTPSKAPLWRVLGNMPQPLNHLVDAAPAGSPIWESSFHISHRINDHLQVGNVYFAGDAAHLHSPVGARGMNLGLEDAYVFSQLAAAGRLDGYEKLRHPVDALVVKRVERVSRMASAQSPILRLVRTALYRFGSRIPFIANQIAHVVTGLDHPLVVDAGKPAEKSVSTRRPHACVS
jgi:2-polyprenyl-6-methoxyphenol hydroxylase-like FAD-dependent oxidoreductase